MVDDYKKSQIYLRRFNELKATFVEEENRKEKGAQLIQADMIEGIEAAISESNQDGMQEEDGKLEKYQFVASSGELLAKDKEQRHEMNLSESIENMTKYTNLIPFELDELILTEKLTLADNLFYEYFNSLDRNLLKALTFVQERIDTTKIENDNSKYGEFVITKLLVKILEENYEKGKCQDFVQRLTCKVQNSSGVLEGIAEAIQIFGIPASQKFKIIFFSLCRLFDPVEAAEAQTSLTKQIRDIINKFYNSLFKDSSFSDLSSLIKENEAKSVLDQSEESNYDNELLTIQKKKRTSFIYLKDLVIPFIMIELKYLQSKFSGEGVVEIESTKETDDLKKMIGIFWLLMKQVGYRRKSEESNQWAYLKDIFHKTWSHKLLTTFKAVLHFILSLFKEHYSNYREENEFPHSSLTIRLVSY